MSLADSSQRLSAIDPSRSFIVQAPAGSGKTSLLVARYLTLLGLAKLPEEIVAITFTRKAASEMRNRILQALSDADIEPANKSQMSQLAKAVLKHDRLHTWQLLKMPCRLRIQTIDSFANQITKQLPLLVNANSNYAIVQNYEAEACYRSAARAMLLHLDNPEYTPQLQRLLVHLDNDWSRFESLAIEMLKRREQWLPHVVGSKSDHELRKKIEASLRNIQTENLEKCQTLFPKALIDTFTTLLNFAVSNLKLDQLTDFKARINKIDFPGWLVIAQLLLTSEFQWRKLITKNQGFPAPSDTRNLEQKAQFQEMKLQMLELLTKLESFEDFRHSLEDLLRSPPGNYTNPQWEIIESLLTLLPLLVAELKLVFQENQVTDYSEISMAALHALGSTQEPTDIALNLDYKVQHLLIDEFQDTSIAQFRLIEKITAGWQNGDGRTLFLVGDPMQSIYRFRDAEVGLFLRAQQSGIGAIKLDSITLTTNFRSTKNIVNWVNESFTKILPNASNIHDGAVPFKLSVAHHQNDSSAVQINLLTDASDADEAYHLVKIVQNLRKQNCDDKIAILVKSRRHLEQILPALQASKLSYQAIELETLGESVVVNDLLALTRALLDLTDRIAWLAVLRAPWIGLTLKDLHTIANGSSELIWENVCQTRSLIVVTKILSKSLQKVGRVTLSSLIEETWLELGGPACVTNENELNDAEQFFALLEESSDDVQVIAEKLRAFYLNTTGDDPNPINVMTIHKAKGLEFDHVILPAIDRSPRSEESKLLLWMEKPRLCGDTDLIFAPIKSANEKIDPIYQYLQLIEKRKGNFEIARLLYVAVTRAKKSLYLIGRVTSEDDALQKIKKGSFLSQLQPIINQNWLIRINSTKGSLSSQVPNHDYCIATRLASNWEHPLSTTFSLQSTPKGKHLQLQWHNQNPAIIGTVIHECLKQLSYSDLASWNPQVIVNSQPIWRKFLIQLGCTDLDGSLEIITTAIVNTLHDPRGCWILKSHREAQSEYAITAKIANHIQHYIIDRTFVDDDGYRWIIDYKTTMPDLENIENFLDQQLLLHQTQLQSYAYAIRQLDPRPIKIGLYFPMFSGWITMDSNCNQEL